mmetsp:Transcript_54622/g.124400  ORF Transcript_54622/g.124400 Transcript_54622/m.124400 type:complete len:436 (+) Transcript_54622:483-1790(+)
MDTLYAALAAARPALESNSRLQRLALGGPTLAGAAAYYSLRPAAASRRASRAMRSPDISFVRRAWAPLSHPWLVRAAEAAASLEFGLRLVSAERCLVGGVPCRIYATRPLTDAPCQVLVYVHGGAFVASLLAADLTVLGALGRATGAVMVYPEYSLAPEHPYPCALDEVLRVYRALDHRRTDAKPALGSPAKTPSKKPNSSGGHQTLAAEAWLEAARIGRIAVVGESAGGNLAAALVCRLARESLAQESLARESLVRASLVRASSAQESQGTVAQEASSPAGRGPRAPDGLVLAYPALNVTLAPSTSRAVHNFDPVLPLGIMYAVLGAYPGPRGEAHAAKGSDPFLSPYHATDELLARFPPTHLIAGGFDPLLDESVDFYGRLRRMGVASSLHVGPALPHGFFGLVKISDAARRAVQTAIDFLESPAIFGRPPPA